jgi:serine protease Do
MIRTTVFSTWLAVAPLVIGQSPAPPKILLGVQSGAYLGVGVIEVNEAAAQRAGLAAPAGVEIANVAQNSPAAAAGLNQGDVVTRFRGETVQGVEHFVRLVRETPVGREVEMEVASSSGERTVSAKIGERQPAFARMPAPEIRMRLSEPVDVDIPRPAMLVSSRSLGATLESIDGQFAGVFGVAEGVLVREVEQNGTAAAAGLQPGDVITSVDGNAVRRTSDVRMELSRTSGDTADLEVMRNKTRKRLEIQTGHKAWTQPLEGARSVSRPK